MIFECLILVLLVNSVCCEEVNFAGLFEQDQLLEKSFNYAIESINKQKAEEDPTITALVQNDVQRDRPFIALQETCKILESGTIAVFGPHSYINIDIVQSICDAKEIPHILTRWKLPVRAGPEINFYPHPPFLSKAFVDIIQTWDWKTFTVLYEDDEGLIRITKLVEDAKDLGMLVDVKKLDSSLTGHYRDTIKDLKYSDQTFFVLDCHIENLYSILEQFQQLGLMNQDYNYLLTNLDAHTENLEPFQYCGANITGIRLLNPESENVQRISAELFSDEPELSGIAAWKLRTEPALLIDAVHMFSHSLSQRRMQSSVPLVNGNNSLSCEDTRSWEHGYSVVNILKTSVYEGLTGTVRFNAEGFRSDFGLNIFELKEGGITDIGDWNYSSGVNLERMYPNQSISESDSLQNTSFVVIITLTEPYGMLKESPENLVGNDRFEGYGVELIQKLAEMEGFNYTFIVREDKANGIYNETLKKWTGMIGDLLEKRADLAITDFTITAQREEVVDFTVPFMSLGISILFKKPQNAPPSFFSFADPFASDTWLALVGSFFFVSFSFYIIGRLCAEEWTNPYPCVEEPEHLCNQFSLWNSIWFVTGSIMCQGSEIGPIAMSTRMLAGVWWFFCLIIIASYTANLTAFLATENPVELFRDLQSLYENKHGVKYGAKEDGATLSFFTHADEGTLFRKVGDYMLKHKENNVKGNEEGVARAEREDEDYAFFMESTSIEYTVQRHCDLQQYGGKLDEKGYGIAMRKNSSYRKRLSLAILKLQSNQWLDQLKTKWWQERRGGGKCQGEGESSDADPLDIRNCGGCFWVTIYGTILSAGLVLIEHLIYLIRVTRNSKLPFWEVFMRELKLYLDFNSESKPVITAEEPSEGKSNSGSMKESVKSKNTLRSSLRSRSMSPRRRASKSKSIKRSTNSKSNNSKSTNSKSTSNKSPNENGFMYSKSTEMIQLTP